MALRADILFTYDTRGRMLCSNDPERRPAPRVFLGCTPDGNVIRFGQDVADDLARRLEAVAERRPPGDDLRIPPATLAAMQEVLRRLAPATVDGGGPAYRFPASISQPRVQGDVVQITTANIDAVRDSYPWLIEELADWGPCFAVVRDGAAVSVCFTSRNGERATEAGVETLPDFRGQGYATAATAAWGAFIAAGGRIPLYSTGWDNLASQAVARRAGLVMFGADASLA